MHTRRPQLEFQNMILYFFLVFSTWHVARGISSFESQLLSDDSGPLENAIAAICRNEIRFSLQLYQAHAEVDSTFIVLSTADAYVGLSQLYFGANGLTKRQLSNVFSYSPDNVLAQRALQNLVHRLNKLQDGDTQMNNVIFHAYPSNVADYFLDMLKIIFDSIPEWLLFWHDLTSGNAILRWSERVGMKYPRSYRFEEEPSLVLGSISRFSSEIDVRRFNACTLTSDFAFPRISSFEYLKMTAEFNYGEFNYSRDFNGGFATAQYIELPQTGKIRTIIILPSERGGIRELENHIDEAPIHKILSNTDMHLVTAILPAYLQMASINDLIEPLGNMELTQMFRESSDFAKISEINPKVGAVVNHAELRHEWIHDDLTCESISTDDFPNVHPSVQAPKTLIANHSFLVLTVSKDENPIILFMGRYGYLPTEGIARLEEWADDESSYSDRSGSLAASSE